MLIINLFINTHQYMNFEFIKFEGEDREQK